MLFIEIYMLQVSNTVFSNNCTRTRRLEWTAGRCRQEFVDVRNAGAIMNTRSLHNIRWTTAGEIETHCILSGHVNGRGPQLHVITVVMYTVWRKMWSLWEGCKAAKHLQTLQASNCWSVSTPFDSIWTNRPLAVSISETRWTATLSSFFCSSCLIAMPCDTRYSKSVGCLTIHGRRSFIGQLELANSMFCCASETTDGRHFGNFQLPRMR